MKKNIPLFLSLCLMIGVIAFIGVHYYTNHHYAKRLISAINEDDYEQVERLVCDSKGNINSFSSWSWLWRLLAEEKAMQNPLQAACAKGNYEIIKLLLDHGADVNKIHSTDDTPLEIACGVKSEKRLDIVRLLMEHGANPVASKYNVFANDHYKTYAILKVVETEYDDTIAVLEYLESKGQQIDGEYPLGSLLHYACREGNSTVIRYLVSERNLPINEQNCKNRTPLICFSLPSAIKKKQDLIFLLENGADKSMQDNDGKTAYDYAIQNGNQEAAALLKP